MTREVFINVFDLSFFQLCTEKGLESYNLGYTCGLLKMGLVIGIITLQEYTFLSDARRCVL